MQIDPWSAVLEELTQLAPAAPAAVTPAQDVRPTAVMSAGPRARPGSVCLLKDRSIAGRRLYAVAYEGLDGHPQRYLIGVEEEPSGWVTCGAAGGSGYPLRCTRPWVNLGGWWGTGRFYAGGDVVAADGACSVRLTTADGVVLEDDTQAGVVLFLADCTVEVPVRVELLDRAGATIAAQRAFDLPKWPG